MTTTPAPQQVVKGVGKAIMIVALEGAALLLAAGRLDWPMAWVLLGGHACLILINTVVLLRLHPDLIAERSAMQSGTAAFDRVLAPLVALVGPLAILVTAGLDHRFSWSPPGPVWAAVAGAGLVLGAGLWTSWGMAANRFFSGTVRIQDDRGHRVVTGGPYRWVRHPGYVGMILFDLGIPVALDARWALIPAVLTAALILLRTALEDRFLQRELPGYREYAAHVRYRLFPGLW